MQDRLMRVLICGDRYWNRPDVVFHVLKKVHEKHHVAVVIEGEAPGADTHGALAAKQLGISVLKFPADWKKYGRAAGPIRNRQMLDEGKPDLVLAFHNNIEESKGTKNMVTIARKYGVLVEIFTESNYLTTLF